MASKPVSKSDPPWQRLKLKAKHVQELKHQARILHLLYHRSHNQHRRSSWWRHFAVFRKQLWTLMEELDPDVAGVTLPSSKIKIFNAGMEQAEKRMAFWAEVMVEKWYDAFSQLIRDPQFAVLGITLLASLAVVVSYLGLFKKMNDGEKANAMKEGLQEASNKHSQLTNTREDGTRLDDDLGVAIERTGRAEEETGLAIVRDDVPEAQSPLAIAAPKKKAKNNNKKRKRGEDEIDDLFSGLF